MLKVVEVRGARSWDEEDEMKRWRRWKGWRLKAKLVTKGNAESMKEMCHTSLSSYVEESILGNYLIQEWCNKEKYR